MTEVTEATAPRDAIPRPDIAAATRVVVKVGSSSLTTPEGEIAGEAAHDDLAVPGRPRAPVDRDDDGVRSGAWRILVGDEATMLDQQVRANPEAPFDYERYPEMYGPLIARAQESAAPES